MVNMKINLSNNIILLCLIIAFIIVYYIFQSYRIDKLNQLINELDMINIEQINAGNKYNNEIMVLAEELLAADSKDEIIIIHDNLKLIVDEYNDKLNSIKLSLKTDKAIEYMNNFTARENLNIDTIMYLSKYIIVSLEDNSHAVSADMYNIINEKMNKKLEEISKKIKVLNVEKANMEEELSKQLKQSIKLN